MLCLLELVGLIVAVDAYGWFGGLVGSGGFLVVLGCCLRVLLWTAATCVGLVGLLLSGS